MKNSAASQWRWGSVDTCRMDRRAYPHKEVCPYCREFSYLHNLRPYYIHEIPDAS